MLLCADIRVHVCNVIFCERERERERRKKPNGCYVRGENKREEGEKRLEKERRRRE